MSRENSSASSTDSSNSSTVDPPAPAYDEASSEELERIDQLFYVYAKSSSNLIGPEAIERLCSDLKLEYTDVKILILAWKMQAATQGYFTLDEWRTGLKDLKADTIAEVKKALVNVEKEVKKSDFADFFAYSFRYSLAEDKQKCMDIKIICTLLDLVLGSQYRAQVDSLNEYLKVQTDYRAINMDQWMGFYRFFTKVDFPDFSNYNPDDAWPVILDDFIDWYRSKGGQAHANGDICSSPKTH